MNKFNRYGSHEFLGQGESKSVATFLLGVLEPIVTLDRVTDKGRQNLHALRYGPIAS